MSGSHNWFCSEGLDALFLFHTNVYLDKDRWSDLSILFHIVVLDAEFHKMLFHGRLPRPVHTLSTSSMFGCLSSSAG